MPLGDLKLVLWAYDRTSGDLTLSDNAGEVLGTGASTRDELVAPARRGVAGDHRVAVIRPDGSAGTILVRTALLPSGAFGVAVDGERRDHAAQLMVADRLTALGALAAGVAHEINNPLAAVIANVSIAQNLAAAQPPRLTELADALRDASDAAARVRDVVRDLKLFARAEDEQIHVVDVRTVLESTLRLAWNQIRHRARLVKQLDLVPSVAANESRLGQVFLNLIINAVEAIPEGHADDHEIHVSTRVENGRVAVAIRDTGIGMTPEVQARLFTPFFTTKPIGEGTGLGLAICQRIVNGLGGVITVESAPGQGTTFTVRLLPTSRPRTATTSPLPTMDRGRARVLIVDDEPLVTTAVRRILGKDHDVIAENSARAALARIEGGDRFDLILCDLMMPEMTGMDLHAELERVAPDQATRMTFLTGGAFTARAREFLDRVTNPRIDKPFSQRDLHNAVAERRR